MAIQKIPNTLIADNAVTASKIANGTLTADDIAANSITAAKLSASTSPTFGGLTVAGTVVADGLTVDTSTLVVDATNNRVGIGTTSPAITLQVVSTASDWSAGIKNYSTDAYGLRVDLSGSSGVGFAQAIYTATGTGLFVVNNGNVGIGTTSPTGGKLHVVGNVFAESGSFYVGGGGVVASDSTTRDLNFAIGNTTPKMTLDTSGNLLVGKTSGPNYNLVGIDLTPLGEIQVTGNSRIVATFNRQTTDGDIAVFRKNGSLVGSIGTEGTDLTIGSGGAALQFLESENRIRPWNMSTNGGSDNVMDLGRSSQRFNDLYLGGGVFLGGTGAANYLDDYEEGTWTPVCRINGSTTGITGNFGGTYTKVGREVTVVCYLNFTNKGSTTGTLKVDSLPFNSGNLGMRFHGSAGYYNVTLSSGDHPRPRLTPQESGFEIQRNHEISPITNTNLANNSEFYITLTYFVD